LSAALAALKGALDGDLEQPIPALGV
jgi:hypothetical protein